LEPLAANDLTDQSTLYIYAESFRLKEKRRAGLLGQPKSKSDVDQEESITD
jgi:hypothetical protein